MKEVKKNFTDYEKIVADKVADEILTAGKDEEERRYFVLLLIFLICLIFLISSLSFAIFDNYYNGGNKNVIDVGIDVVVDDDGDKDIDKDEDSDKDESDKGNRPGHSGKPGDDEDKDDHDFKPIKPSSVLFSFNEGSNYIDMVDVFPTYDNVGKKLSGDKQYFDFNVSATFGNSNKGTLVYEIALVPISGNTVDEDKVRVYLTEDGKEVSVMDDMVNNFGDLPDSSYHKNGKVIYRKAIKKNYVGNYVFRMWLSSEADVAKVSEKFACKVVVNAYYR